MNTRRSRFFTLSLLFTLLLGCMASVGWAHPDSRAGSRHRIKVKVYGEIQSIEGNRWIVSGYRVRVTPWTDFEDDVEKGDYVKVKGFEDGDNNWVITEVELEDRDKGDESLVEFKITGRVQAINGDIWVVAGRTIYITEDTDIEDDVSVGDRVKVEASRKTPGKLTASEVDRKG